MRPACRCGLSGGVDTAGAEAVDQHRGDDQGRSRDIHAADGRRHLEQEARQPAFPHQDRACRRAALRRTPPSRSSRTGQVRHQAPALHAACRELDARRPRVAAAAAAAAGLRGDPELWRCPPSASRCPPRASLRPRQRRSSAGAASTARTTGRSGRQHWQQQRSLACAPSRRA